MSVNVVRILPSAHRRIVLVGAVALVAAGLVPVARATTMAPSADLSIQVLSSRADLVSGGDALVQVGLPDGVRSATVDVNGRDVTNQFALRANGRFQALLTGLALGRNDVEARTPDGHAAVLTITNHPQGGPVFSGPQIQPWTCGNGVKDKQCNQAPTYAYFYKSVLGGSLQSYNPDSPPSDVATTTTQNGTTVPFIVRQETGYSDRDQYAIAVLWQPGKRWQPWAPQKQWINKLVLTHGASCDTSYASGTAPSVLLEDALSRGFAVASHALDNAGHNCNIITQAESLLMVKERVIKELGPLRWTIGSGCSGGSLVQQQVANAYPGVYQGISPQCSFTDAWSSAQQYVDYTMLLRYFQDPSRWDPGTTWDPVSIGQVLGHPNVGNPVTFTTAIPNASDPSRSCPGVDAAKVYDPKTNPKGVKCTLQDYMVNVFGKRSDGFANRAFGNTGIQYGLVGLRKGLITPQQFVDLNTNLGGLDINGDVSPKRNWPDLPGLQRVYTTGAANEANNLDKVAIIDLRGPDPGAFHDVYRTYSMRARLMRNFGTAANQVLWRGQVPLLGDTNYADEAIVALDKWLTRVDADKRSTPLAAKIIQDKPGDVADRCTNGSGTDLPSEVCDETVAAYGTPRIAADAPLADDVLQCQLKPLRKDDYPVAFTADQWSRLSKVYAKGVCDYSKPGVDQRGATGWLTFQDAQGKVVYGGAPLGPPPVSHPV
ncbi:MAG: N-acetylmuramoyl-L-alanine amidase [Frankiales bacterium]|nr:N-acetylmuramoyl-L-alanine amidase [Frankiales bacterium]